LDGHLRQECDVEEAVLKLPRLGIPCEERFPDGASNSVLVVVVDRDAATWGERLKPAYEKLFGNRPSGSPEDLRLEVIDRSTEDAIRRLCESGLLQARIRATRHLHPKGDTALLALSDEECARKVHCRSKRSVLTTGKSTSAERDKSKPGRLAYVSKASRLTSKPSVPPKALA
jgi:hypothetical protein